MPEPDTQAEPAPRSRGRMAHPAAVEFIERLGLLTQAEGLPRISGRLIGLMVLEGGPLAFGELSEKLGVSRGSISTNMRLLEGIGVVERVGVAGHRGDFFRLADSPYDALLEGAKRRATKGEQIALEARDALRGQLDDAAVERIAELGAFYGGLVRVLASVEAEIDKGE